MLRYGLASIALGIAMLSPALAQPPASSGSGGSSRPAPMAPPVFIAPPAPMPHIAAPAPQAVHQAIAPDAQVEKAKPKPKPTALPIGVQAPPWWLHYSYYEQREWCPRTGAWITVPEYGPQNDPHYDRSCRLTDAPTPPPS